MIIKVKNKVYDGTFQSIDGISVGTAEVKLSLYHNNLAPFKTVYSGQLRNYKYCGRGTLHVYDDRYNCLEPIATIEGEFTEEGDCYGYMKQSYSNENKIISVARHLDSSIVVIYAENFEVLTTLTDASLDNLSGKGLMKISESESEYIYGNFVRLNPVGKIYRYVDGNLSSIELYDTNSTLLDMIQLYQDIAAKYVNINGELELVGEYALDTLNLNGISLTTESYSQLVQTSTKLANKRMKEIVLIK